MNFNQYLAKKVLNINNKQENEVDFNNGKNRKIFRNNR